MWLLLKLLLLVWIVFGEWQVSLGFSLKRQRLRTSRRGRTTSHLLRQHQLLATTTTTSNNDSSSSATNPPPPSLTIIFPAYNEINRIGPTLQECLSYLDDDDSMQPSSFSKYNLLVVDDGSTDGTSDFVLQQQQQQQIECLRLDTNQGKGAAIEAGIRHVLKKQERRKLLLLDKQDDSIIVPSSHLILLADADGSANISQNLPNMLKELYHLTCHDLTRPALVVGNRNNSNDDDDGSSFSSFSSPKSTTTTTIIPRSITRWGFQTCVQLLVGRDHLGGVLDTQCGFKLLTLSAAKRVFEEQQQQQPIKQQQQQQQKPSLSTSSTTTTTTTTLYLKRWTYDVEFLWRCQTMGVLLSEIPIVWKDKVEGSKLVKKNSTDVVWVSLIMLLEIFWMRLNFEIGRWKV